MTVLSISLVDIDTGLTISGVPVTAHSFRKFSIACSQWEQDGDANISTVFFSITSSRVSVGFKVILG